MKIAKIDLLFVTLFLGMPGGLATQVFAQDVPPTEDILFPNLDEGAKPDSINVQWGLEAPFRKEWQKDTQAADYSGDTLQRTRFVLKVDYDGYSVRSDSEAGAYHRWFAFDMMLQLPMSREAPETEPTTNFQATLVPWAYDSKGMLEHQAGKLLYRRDAEVGTQRVSLAAYSIELLGSNPSLNIGGELTPLKIEGYEILGKAVLDFVVGTMQENLLTGENQVELIPTVRLSSSLEIVRSDPSSGWAFYTPALYKFDISAPGKNFDNSYSGEVGVRQLRSDIGFLNFFVRGAYVVQQDRLSEENPGRKIRFTEAIFGFRIEK